MDDVPFRKRLIVRRARKLHNSRARSVVRRGFSDSLLALSPARRHVRDSLAGWLLTDDEQDTVVLVANELVSNAVKHARTVSRVTLRRSRKVVHVLVRDYSAHPPRPGPGDSATSEPSEDTSTFHGLAVVDAAATRWGWHRHAMGKTVWATITVVHPYGFI